MIFLINFVVDFFILYGVMKVLKINIRIYRIILGSIIGGLSIVILFVKSNCLVFLIKIFICFILGGSFYLFDIGSTYKNTGMFIINNSFIFNFIILVIGSPLIIYLFVRECIGYRNIYSNKYIVEISINNNLYKFEGIIDTGNRLKDPYKNRDVVLINKNINLDISKYVYVPYHALDNNGVIPCIKPDYVLIDKKYFNNCLIGLSKDKFNLDGVSCILPNKFKEDL